MFKTNRTQGAGVVVTSRSASGGSFFCSFSSPKPRVLEDTVLPSSSGSPCILHGVSAGSRCSSSLISPRENSWTGWEAFIVFWLATRPFSVIEEKGEGFEKRKKDISGRVVNLQPLAPSYHRKT